MNRHDLEGVCGDSRFRHRCSCQTPATPERQTTASRLAKTSMEALHDSLDHAMESSVILNTAKAFEDACSDLKAAATKHGFGVLAVHDLAATLRSKYISFAEQCRVFEVCNPQQAAKLLAEDLCLSMALPCRISIYTESGQTKIAMIRPVAMLRDLSSLPGPMEVAQEVESTMTTLVQEVAASTSTR